MLARSSTTSPLTSLVLDVGRFLEMQEIPKGNLAHILHATPNTRNLELMEFIQGGEDVLKTLTVSERSYLVPMLKKLALNLTGPDCFSDGNLLTTMIDSRRKLGALQSVIVKWPDHDATFQEIFDLFALKKLKTFAAEGLLIMDGIVSILHLSP